MPYDPANLLLQLQTHTPPKRDSPTSSTAARLARRSPAPRDYTPTFRPLRPLLRLRAPARGRISSVSTPLTRGPAVFKVLETSMVRRYDEEQPVQMS